MNYNIHIIDDDPISQMIARKAVQMTNRVSSISTFNNGREAIDFLKKHTNNPILLPDIIFLDINMPILDGWGFMNEFITIKSSLSKRILIYMLSSSIAEEDINRAKAMPEIHQYVVKPMKKATILEIGNSWQSLFSLQQAV